MTCREVNPSEKSNFIIKVTSISDGDITTEHKGFICERKIDAKKLLNDVANLIKAPEKNVKD